MDLSEFEASLVYREPGLLHREALFQENKPKPKNTKTEIASTFSWGSQAGRRGHCLNESVAEDLWDSKRP